MQTWLTYFVIILRYSSSSRGGRELDNFDPDEQAILRLMHENMRDWDQVNLINTDQLRRKFQEIDPHATHILTLREVSDHFLRDCRRTLADDHFIFDF